MIYVVLGMHKSGTTLVSGMLHQSGIEMVEDFEPAVGYDGGNKMERRSVVQINDALLDSSGRFSLSISARRLPATLPSPQEQAMRVLIRSQSAKGCDWGFKDPRTCLTYPFWASCLPPHALIVVYRGPAQVVEHYHSPVRPWRALLAYRRWREYNLRVVRILRATPQPYVVIEYGQLMVSDHALDKLSRFVGRRVIDDRDARRFRNRGEEGPLFRLARMLNGPPRDGEIVEELRAFESAAG